MIHQKKIEQFYKKRYLKLGKNIKSVGWGSSFNQNLRFKILLKDINLTNKTILDYGCGFSDLFLYLKKIKNIPKQYVGYDIIKEFIYLNRKKFKSNKYYYNENLLNLFHFDFIICSGVFSFKTSTGRKYFRSKSLNLLKKSKKALLINFLSINTKHKLKKNFYYNEKEVLNFFGKVKKIKLNLIKSYGLNEFTLQIIKT